MKYFIYIILTIIGFTFQSCSTAEFLNPLPDTAVVADAFFPTDAVVLAGIIGSVDAVQGVNEKT